MAELSIEFFAELVTWGNKTVHAKPRGPRGDGKFQEWQNVFIHRITGWVFLNVKLFFSFH